MIAVMCFVFLNNLFTELTVHLYMYLSETQDSIWVVDMTIQYTVVALGCSKSEAPAL